MSENRNRKSAFQKDPRRGDRQNSGDPGQTESGRPFRGILERRRFRSHGARKGKELPDKTVVRRRYRMEVFPELVHGKTGKRSVYFPASGQSPMEGRDTGSGPGRGKLPYRHIQQTSQWKYFRVSLSFFGEGRRGKTGGTDPAQSRSWRYAGKYQPSGIRTEKR